MILRFHSSWATCWAIVTAQGGVLAMKVGVCLGDGTVQTACSTTDEWRKSAKKLPREPKIETREQYLRVAKRWLELAEQSELGR